MEKVTKNINIMSTSPNQKVIVTKRTLSDAEHTYSRTNIEAMLTAAKILSDRAFKLYARMNLHTDDFTYALSPVAIRKAIGMSDDKYRAAVKELQTEGYLVLVPGRKNLFFFYEYPQKDCAEFSTREPGIDTANHIADIHGDGAHMAEHAVETGMVSMENEEMDGRIQPGNSADSGLEIQQDITENTPRDNERNTPENTIMDIPEDVMRSGFFTIEETWQSLTEKRKREQQFEQECRDYEAIMSCVDPDDRHFFDHMNPYRDMSFETEDDNIDWDDPDLPF